MKTKLTLTVDRALVEFGKDYATRRRISLSRLVEEALRQLKQSEGPTFSQRWRGRFADVKEPNAERLRHLERKLG